MKMINAVYQPGVRNISGVEIEIRRQTGFIGVALTGLGFVFLQAANVHPLGYLVLSIPIWVSAFGFMQASMKFCVIYGLRGMHITQDRYGLPEPVIDGIARANDRNKAYSIILRSAIITSLLTLFIVGILV